MNKDSPAKNTIQDILEKMKQLEEELVLELQKKEKEFLYEIAGKKVLFYRTVKEQHRQAATRIHHYLRESAPLNVLTAPVIYAIWLPALLLDLFLYVYQSICFPIYKIPKVRRGDYIVLDRHRLAYLNAIERFNCVYCGYFNGLIAYAREVAARTEQYWCPIKHARKLIAAHTRYHKFVDYGDAAGYHSKLETIRKQYEKT